MTSRAFREAFDNAKPGTDRMIEKFLRGGIHFCSGANINPDKIEDLRYDEEDIAEFEKERNSHDND